MDTNLQTYIVPLEIAKSLLLWSDDKHKKVSAVAFLEKEKRIIAVGVNRFPKNIQVTLDRLEKQFKNTFMLSATEVLLTDALENGVSLFGADVVLTAFPSIQDAKLLIEAGIWRLFVVFNNNEKNLHLDFHNIIALFTEAGVHLQSIDDESH